jgi:hypothetical protein
VDHEASQFSFNLSPLIVLGSSRSYSYLYEGSVAFDEYPISNVTYYVPKENAIPFQSFYENFVEMEPFKKFHDDFTEKDAGGNVSWKDNISRSVDIWPSFVNVWNENGVYTHFNFPFSTVPRSPLNKLVEHSSLNGRYTFRNAIAYIDQSFLTTGMRNIGTHIHNMYADFDQYFIYSVNGNNIIKRRYEENNSAEKMSYMLKVDSSNNVHDNSMSIVLSATYPGSGYNELRFKIKKNESSYIVQVFRGIDLIDMYDIPNDNIYQIFDRDPNQYSKYFYI